ncbi:MAG: hypothetical protein IJV02_06225, partial [Candidatus Methanomethylophilaceae archaeon]|nr:hypothetical protein [Candidatus Methanomethylophilaceae archaeon]
TIGTASVTSGNTVKISDIELTEAMDGKKITGLYVDSTLETKFTATVTSDITIYASVEDKSATENFFDEHGWLFILFGVIG